MEIRLQTYVSPCGELLLGSYADKLCLCDWTAGARHERVMARVQRYLKAPFLEEPSEITRQAALQLDEFFAGKRRAFDLPLLLAGTDFQQKVWRNLLKIPYGQTLSYRQTACLLGRPEAVRAIANANGANALSIVIPCHRVIGHNGSLTGYGGGLTAKRFLLELEGANPAVGHNGSLTGYGGLTAKGTNLDKPALC